MTRVLFIILTLLISSNAMANTKGQSEEVLFRVDAGINYYSIRIFEDILSPITPYNDFEWGQVLALSAMKRVSDNQFIAAQIDWQNIENHSLFALRAFEYNHQLADNWTTHAFVGAARYDYRTPAYGYTVGFGMRVKSWPMENFGVTIEAQYHDKLARDKLTADDLSSSETGPDMFFDVRALNFTLNYYF